MSTWYDIEDKDCISISGNGEKIEILLGNDYWGNHYIEVPVKFIIPLIKKIIDSNTTT